MSVVSETHPLTTAADALATCEEVPSIETLAALDVPSVGMLIANMLVSWIDAQSSCSTAVENAHEQQDHRVSFEQTRVHIPATVNSGTGTPSSTEYRTSVRVARESTATGLDRGIDSGAGSGPGTLRKTQHRSRRLQDSRSRGVDGSGGCGVRARSIPPCTLERRLGAAAGAVCADANGGP